MARTGKIKIDAIYKAKKIYWERLRRNPHYIKDFEYVVLQAAKKTFNLEKTTALVASMARYYYLIEMLPPNSNFSDAVASRIRFTDAMIKIKVHKGYWPLHQTSFGFPIDRNDKGGFVLAPYKRSESLIFGRYLQVAVDIEQPIDNIVSQVADAVKMARTVLVNDVTGMAHKKTRSRPEDTELQFKAWDMYHIDHIKMPDIGQTLWGKKDREEAKRYAFHAITRANDLIRSVIGASYVDLNGLK